MIDELKKHLLSKDIDPSVLEDFDFSEESAEEDLIADALDTLSKAMNSKKKKDDDMEEDDDETMDPELDDDDEDEDDDMEKGGGYQYMDKMKDMQDAMKMMAKGTDDILNDMEKRFGAVANGLESVLKEMQFYRRENKEIKKSLRAHFDEPLAPRASLSAVPASAPTRGASTENRQELISKAIKQMQDPNVDGLRKSALLSAVSRLESGASVLEVAQTING